MALGPYPAIPFPHQEGQGQLGPAPTLSPQSFPSILRPHPPPCQGTGLCLIRGWEIPCSPPITSSLAVTLDNYSSWRCPELQAAIPVVPRWILQTAAWELYPVTVAGRMNAWLPFGLSSALWSTDTESPLPTPSGSVL